MLDPRYYKWLAFSKRDPTTREAVVRDDAPEEMKKNYQEYLKQKEAAEKEHPHTIIDL